VCTQYRLAAGYVDRIFKGEKPWPVQPPAKYDTAINLKTKARSLTYKVIRNNRLAAREAGVGPQRRWRPSAGASGYWGPADINGRLTDFEA
jgi:hypothetical protein